MPPPPPTFVPGKYALDGLFNFELKKFFGPPTVVVLDWAVGRSSSSANGF